MRLETDFSVLHHTATFRRYLLLFARLVVNSFCGMLRMIPVFVNRWQDVYIFSGNSTSRRIYLMSSAVRSVAVGTCLVVP